MQRPSSGRRHGAALTEGKEKPAAAAAGSRVGGGGAGACYKAAYYSPLLNSGSGGYFTYATQSDSASGNVIGGGSNQANYHQGARYAVTQSSGFSVSQNYLTHVVAFSDSTSFYGTFDQSGNVLQ